MFPLRRLTPEEQEARRVDREARDRARSDEMTRLRKEEREARTRMRDAKAVVYVIECAGVHKIGTTTNLPARVRQIQAMCPHPVTVVHSVKGGRALEQRIHGKYRHRHSHGEWFDLDAKDVDTIRSVYTDR
jgi:hypothetical protein